MPDILAPDFDAIPEFLRQLPYWNAWIAVKRNGKITKPPVSVSRRLAKVNDLATWTDFKTAKDFYEAHAGHILPGLQGPIGGVGILVDGIVGIDFDSVYVYENVYTTWAAPLIKQLKPITYCETSPSQTGVHAFLRCQKPKGKCRRNGLEVYDSKRFLTVTGARLPDCQDTIASGQQAQTVMQALDEYLNSTGEGETESSLPVEVDSTPLLQAELTDDDLLNKARSSKNGRNFSRLFDSGDISGHKSASEADQGLCNYLAFWTGKDAERMDRLMRQSALLREPERIAKWEKAHSQGATYGEMTIAKAIADIQAVYDPLGKKSAKSTSRQKASRQEICQSDDLPLSEDDLAVRFVAKHKDNMRFCHDSGRWHGWNGQIWKRETIQEGLDRIRLVCKEAAELAGITERKRLLRAQLFCNVDKIARTDGAVAVTSEIWDKDAYLLGTPGGTVDLRTGELRQAKPSDYITKSVSIAPDKNSFPSLWLKFIAETTGGDDGLQRFLQQICGMVLTGDISEHVLIFVYGPGGNGKSVFMNVLTEILADYAANAPMETFTLTGTDRHPTELAMLRGARLVTASETEEGRYWAESKIKQMTGGDMLTARFMRQDFFQYKPQFKLLIIGNHKPSIRTLDDAMKRRINIIPFTQRPREIDHHLNEKLRAEYPAILHWMIEGCLDWQANGLQRPECVMRATEDYFTDQDLISQWIDECCNTDPQFSGKSSTLFASWKEFAERNGIKPGNSKGFKASMERRGYENKHTSTAWVFRGICLKPQEEEKWRLKTWQE